MVLTIQASKLLIIISGEITVTVTDFYYYQYQLLSILSSDADEERAFILPLD